MRLLSNKRRGKLTATATIHSFNPFSPTAYNQIKWATVQGWGDSKAANCDQLGGGDSDNTHVALTPVEEFFLPDSFNKKKTMNEAQS